MRITSHWSDYPIYLQAGDRIEVQVEDNDPIDLTGLPLEVLTTTIGMKHSLVVLEAHEAMVLTPADLFESGRREKVLFEGYRGDLAAFHQYRNDIISSLQEEP